MELKKVKLKDITEVITKGTTPTTIGYSYTEKGVNFIKIESITNRGEFLINKMTHISSECHTKMKRSELKENDIVFSIAGAIGRSAIIKKELLPANTNQALAIIRLNYSELNIEFLLKFLKSEYIFKQFEKMKQGVAQLNLSLKDIGELEIIYPNLEMQNKIIRSLDKAQGLRDKRKEQIEALDELVKSKFIEMFGNPISNSKGWDTKSLGDICELKAGKNIKAADIFEEATEELYPCYGGNGLRGYVKSYSHEGNINLIGRQGALCGNVKFAMGKFYATEHAVVTQPKVEMNSYWLYFVLTELNLNRLATGAAQPGLTVGALNEVQIPVVDIRLQNQFVDFVNQVDKLKFEMENSLKELEDNFNSLMQKAFKGELFN